MTPRIDSAAKALDTPVAGDELTPNIIWLSEEDFIGADFARFETEPALHEDSFRAMACDSTTADDSSQRLNELEKLADGIEVRKKPLYYRFIKRTFDIAFSGCVIVLGFLPGLVLSGFIVADTKGSPIYLSSRVGRGGKEFRIFKFRTMVADADDLEKYFTPEQLDQWHREHKVDDDPRITKLGAFLRSSSIDEFPQFINVLFGQMSTIGSRAVTVEEAEYYGEGKGFILSMRPGIAWDIIAPKPGAGKKVSGARILPAYEGSRTVRTVAA